MDKLHHEIERTKRDLTRRLSACQTIRDLKGISTEFAGRNGAISRLMTQLSKASQEEKRKLGPELNSLKQVAENAIAKRGKEIARAEALATDNSTKNFDVTASTKPRFHGHLHPYTLMQREFEDILVPMGFERVEGPEVETAYNDFEALNIPPDHPAVDTQDTFWLTLPGYLLRTQTSPVQIREMHRRKPPIAIFSPGVVYRHEATDASHDYMFMQVEGLLIDKKVSLAHLFSTIKQVVRKLFNNDKIEIRVRPGYFPFVEPGLEVDLTCPFCKSGCAVCQKSGWIEMGGAGLVHPNVLRNGGVDPDEYSGFAFGMGLTRFAMLKYGIDDVRLFLGGNMEFLCQF